MGNMGGRVCNRDGSDVKYMDPAAIHLELGFRRFHQIGWVYLPTSVQCLLDKLLTKVPESQEREGSNPCSHLCLICSRRSHIPHYISTEQAVMEILKKELFIVAQKLLGHERELLLLPSDCSEMLKCPMQLVMN